MQTWCVDATLPTLLFLSEVAIFSKQASDAAALGTNAHRAAPFLAHRLLVTSRGSEVLDWNPPYEMSVLTLGCLREGISSPWFSAAVTIPDCTYGGILSH